MSSIENNYPDARFIEYARALLVAAEHDLEASKLLWGRNNIPSALFHLQQAAEKIVKAIRSVHQYIFVEFMSYVVNELSKNPAYINIYIDENNKHLIKIFIELLKLRIEEHRITIEDFEKKLKSQYSHKIAEGITDDLKGIENDLQYYVGVLKGLFIALGLSSVSVYIDKSVEWIKNEFILFNVDWLNKSKSNFANDLDKIYNKLQLAKILLNTFTECRSKTLEKLSNLKLIPVDKNELVYELLDDRVYDLAMSITIFIFYVSKIAKELSSIEQSSRYPILDSKTKNVIMPSESIQGIATPYIYDKVYNSLSCILNRLKRSVEFIYEILYKNLSEPSTIKLVKDYISLAYSLLIIYMIINKKDSKKRTEMDDIWNKIQNALEHLFNQDIKALPPQSLTEFFCREIDQLISFVIELFDTIESAITILKTTYNSPGSLSTK